jgi:alcohol dehydrogenase
MLKGFDVSRFHGFEINPKVRDIKEGIKLSKGCDMVVSIGGGTVIDVGKSVAILSQQEDEAEAYVTGSKKITKPGLAFIAIPTTFGTGSESTHFSVVYIDKTKYSLASEFMMPKAAIVDPVFAKRSLQWLKANTAFDALNQAIESAWSVNSTKESLGYSINALNVIIPMIVDYATTDDPEAALAMANGSNYAGRAINIAKTTGAHSVSYPITSYFNVPHGQAVAITLQEFIGYNAAVTEETKQGNQSVDEIRKNLISIYRAFNVENGTECAKVYRQMMADVGLKLRLSELGIKNKEDLGLILKNGYNPERMKNNPRTVPEENLMAMLLKVA